MRKNIRNAFILIALVTGLLTSVSCSKNVELNWGNYKEAFLMGYMPGEACASGYIFDVIEDANQIRAVKYAKELPPNISDLDYMSYPLKVRIEYVTIEDNDCYLTAEENIVILKMELSAS